MRNILLGWILRGGGHSLHLHVVLVVRRHFVLPTEPKAWLLSGRDGGLSPNANSQYCIAKYRGNGEQMESVLLLLRAGVIMVSVGRSTKEGKRQHHGHTRTDSYVHLVISGGKFGIGSSSHRLQKWRACRSHFLSLFDGRIEEKGKQLPLPYYST